MIVKYANILFFIKGSWGSVITKQNPSEEAFLIRNQK